jgi:hypothetical protein
MVRPENELVEVAVHILGRDVNVRAGDGVLEQTPEAFNRFRVMGRIVAIVVIGELARAVLDGAVLEPVAL